MDNPFLQAIQESEVKLFESQVWYDSETGKLYSLTKRGRGPCIVNVGDELNTLHVEGYIHISINGKQYLGHRIAWALYYGNLPKGEIDHKNCNKSDNKIENLRLATHSQNQSNSGKYKNNKSGFKGVTLQGGRWRAVIQAEGKQNHLGYFSTPEEAHEAYSTASEYYHGEFSKN